MAKHTGKRRGRKFRRYMRGRVDEGLALLTLGSKVLLSNTWDEVVVERTLLSSIEVAWSLSDFTQMQTDGPIQCGIAHSDYTDAEIEENIENTGSWDEGNLVQREVGQRKIRIIGTFPSAGPASGASQSVLNDGKPIKTKLNWILTTGDTLKMWAYNAGTGALTTGAVMHATGVAHLWPQ